MKKTALIVLIGLLLCSCATPQQPPAPQAPEPPAERELVLPDLPVKSTAKKAEEAPRQPPRPPVTIEQQVDDKYVILNFDEADIETVIATMGDLLQINYILSPGISGKVTIQSYKKFPVRDLFSVFQSILEMNGLTAVKNKDFYVILPIDSAKQQGLDVEKGKDVAMKLDSSFITQIVPLEYVKAADAVNLLRGVMPRGTDLIVYEPTNLLIITARPEGIIKFMKIMEAIDIAPSDRENIRTFVYYVENGEAKKLAEILNEIYLKKGPSSGTAPATLQPRPPVPRPGAAPAEPQSATSTVIGGSAGELEGDITITAYEDINALIIKSSPGAYLALVDTIKKLDIPPKQVLIECLVAELTLTDSLSLGVEWLLKTQGDPTFIGGYKGPSVEVSSPDIDVQPGAIPAGFFGLVIDPSKFIGLIRTLAIYGKVNILSSPHVLALDNKEAKIELGDEVPIATGLNTSTTGTTTGATLVSSGQIQYKTVGVLLTVTPHVSDKDKVTLKVSQEFSGPGEQTEIAGTTFPSFFTRRTQTTGIVQDGHTLVIGGLISENTTDSSSGLPFLSKIPIIGKLFGTSTSTVRRTELIVMVTPHVVRDQEEADRVTAEFMNRVRTIKERLEEFQQEEKEKLEEEKRKEQEKVNTSEETRG